jgi:hypothetical protein
MEGRDVLFSMFVFAVIAIGVPQILLAELPGEQKRSWYGNTLAKGDDHDGGHKDRNRERERHQEGRRGKSDLNPVNHPTYKENCGACHFAYQPGLLPSASWKKILVGTEGHFGESFELDPATKAAVLAYLDQNAAERSIAKRSAKIMKSLGNSAPMRITEIPYIMHKHHDISASVLKRRSIGSLSNCTACHQRAEEGIYDDHDVVIPK